MLYRGDRALPKIYADFFLLFGSVFFANAALSAPVYWNECFDKGGVRVFLDKCECVDGYSFRPRSVSDDFICAGVGSEEYLRALNAGQPDRTGRRAPNVVEMFHGIPGRLDQECQRVWEAACYNAQLESCICRNGYSIGLREVWPMTRNCLGKYVSYGFAETAPGHSQPQATDGDFDGVLEVVDNSSCRFRYGEDVELVNCAVEMTPGNIVQLELDYSQFHLRAFPACYFDIIGRNDENLYISHLNEKSVTVRYRAKATQPEDPYPEECQQSLFGNSAEVELVTAFCAISGVVR